MKQIGDILNENRDPVYAEFWRITKIWQAAMTKNIAEATTPIKNDKNGLLVLVHDNIWLTELNYLKEEIKEKLGLHGLKIEEITFKHRPAYEKIRISNRKIYEITTEKQKYIDEIVKNIDNEQLRAGFEKAIIAYFKTHSLEEFING